MFSYNDFKVLCVGVSTYQDETITNIPNVESNLSALSELFNDSNLFPEFKESNLVISLNQSQKEVTRHIIDITSSAKSSDILILYFAGHGIISSDDFELYLPVHDSLEKYISSEGINTKFIKSAISKSDAKRKVLLMDCCYSGKVHGTMNVDGVKSELRSKILPVVDGTYIMTSSSPDKPSLYSADDNSIPTFFTNKIIDVISTGVDNNKPYYEIGEIFNEVKSEFEKIGSLPIPQQSSFNEAEKIPFGNNLRETSIKQLLKENRDLKIIVKDQKTALTNLEGLVTNKEINNSEVIKLNERVNFLESNTVELKNIANKERDEAKIERNRNQSLELKVNDLEKKNKSIIAKYQSAKSKLEKIEIEKNAVYKSHEDHKAELNRLRDERTSNIKRISQLTEEVRAFEYKNRTNDNDKSRKTTLVYVATYIFGFFISIFMATYASSAWGGSCYYSAPFNECTAFIWVAYIILSFAISKMIIRYGK